MYICHGSRVKKARDEAVAFIEKCSRQIAVPIQEICFLELAEPDISSGIEACVKQGAEQIAVIPVLLLTAAHAKSDIPEELEKALKKHPDVEISYGAPIGVQGSMAEAVLEQTAPLPADEDVRLLLVGRGSSDPDVKKDLQEIASGIVKRTEGLAVTVCYLTAAEPAFSEVLKKIGTFRENSVYIVPYLLFTGLLMKGIEKEIQNLSSEKNIRLCSYVGFSQHTEAAFVKRVREALNGLQAAEGVSRYAPFNA
nr:sirohydrochlorin chelatase [Metabacillus mangrovi]